jgi:hypothetical protein
MLSVRWGKERKRPKKSRTMAGTGIIKGVVVFLLHFLHYQLSFTLIYIFKPGRIFCKL